MIQLIGPSIWNLHARLSRVWVIGALKMKALKPIKGPNLKEMEQTSFVIFPQDSLLLSPNLRHISTLKKPFYGWNKKVFGKCEK